MIDCFNYSKENIYSRIFSKLKVSSKNRLCPGDVAILILKMAWVCMITFLLTFVATVSIGVTLSTGEFMVVIYNYSTDLLTWFILAI